MSPPRTRRRLIVVTIVASALFTGATTETALATRSEPPTMTTTRGDTSSVTPGTLAATQMIYRWCLDRPKPPPCD